MLELNALLAVHRLLLLERAVVEQLLQALVRVVDAQLLEAVLLEDLEPEDVQKPDEFVPLSVQVLVDLLHLLSHTHFPHPRSNRTASRTAPSPARRSSGPPPTLHPFPPHTRDNSTG